MSTTDSGQELDAKVKYGYCSPILIQLVIESEGVDVGELPEKVRAQLAPRKFLNSTYERSLLNLIASGLIEVRVVGGRAKVILARPSSDFMERRRTSSLSTVPAELRAEIGTVVDDPDGWLNRPNVQFGGRPPIELIGTAEEPKLRNLIRAAGQGAFS